jgi:hypothetical protein
MYALRGSRGMALLIILLTLLDWCRWSVLRVSATLRPWERTVVPVVPQIEGVTELNRIIQCGMNNFLCHV